MSESGPVSQSPREFFRQRVGDVLSHRRVRVQPETEFYLVDLLAKFLEAERLRVEQADGSVREEALALILLRALEATGDVRVRELRRLGDTALFVSGFFGDSLSRSAVDVDYYIAMGGQAYAVVGQAERRRGLDALFGELSERFGLFVDCFAEIAELADLRSDRGLVRLYERWLRTRSARVAQLLRERGVALLGDPPAPPRGARH
ncbi:MAG TPA: hypothetical protein VLT61_04195 [Anaeromyxobacteraceae bacterium]|nr:hypothetical protein [Anaeromyxobacteraceae bacterium]